jgi:hypothetical protein
MSFGSDRWRMGKTKPTVYLIDADCFRVLCRECHTRNMLTRWRRSKNSGGGIAPTAIAASYRGLASQRQRFPALPKASGRP